MSGIVMGPGEAVHRIAELRAPEVAERIQGGAAVILPLGSLETHGPQAPMGDFMLAEVIADSIAAAAADNGADTLVLPALPFGGEDFFAGVPGGISLSTPVLQSIIEETIAGLVRNGVRRILIVNGHGGNIPAVEAAARHARRAHDIIIPALHLWKVAGAWQEELGGEAASLGHGGDPVWSVALFLAPELCRPDRARPREPRRRPRRPPACCCRPSPPARPPPCQSRARRPRAGQRARRRRRAARAGRRSSQAGRRPGR
jgi:creatinine amidohydrolase